MNAKPNNEIMPQQQQQQMTASTDFLCLVLLSFYLLLLLCLSLFFSNETMWGCWNHFCSLSTDQEDLHQSKKNNLSLEWEVALSLSLSFFVAQEDFIRCPRSPPGTVAASCWPPAWGRSTDASCCCPETSSRPRWTAAWLGPPWADAAGWPACRPEKEKKHLLTSYFVRWASIEKP